MEGTSIYNFLFYAVMILGVSFVGLIIYYGIVTKRVTVIFSDGAKGLGKTTKGGRIENGGLEGYREVKIDNGSTLKGEFKNGLLHGVGKVYQPDGIIIEGPFDTGKQTDGFRTYYLKDSTFSGYEKDGKKVGDRKIVYNKPKTGETLHFDENGKYTPNSIINH